MVNDLRERGTPSIWAGLWSTVPMSWYIHSVHCYGRWLATLLVTLPPLLGRICLCQHRPTAPSLVSHGFRCPLPRRKWRTVGFWEVIESPAGVVQIAYDPIQLPRERLCVQALPSTPSPLSLCIFQAWLMLKRTSYACRHLRLRQFAIRPIPIFLLSQILRKPWIITSPKRSHQVVTPLQILTWKLRRPSLGGRLFLTWDTPSSLPIADYSLSSSWRILLFSSTWWFLIDSYWHLSMQQQSTWWRAVLLATQWSSMPSTEWCVRFHDQHRCVYAVSPPR
jgi:hypothetical protein